MLRSLTGSILFISLGALAGLAFGSFTFGVLGAVAGMVAWLFWLGIAPTSRASEGAWVARDRRRLLCIPTGQTTTCVFKRSRRSGRFLDVECCDLQDPHDEVNCDKKCLVLMNDVARREPVADTA